jgi:hypothetical protein
MAVEIRDLFEKAQLEAHGPLPWGTQIEERGPGVYVISLSPEVSPESIVVPVLDPLHASRWVRGEHIVYIGRTRRALRNRLGEFYRHVYGRNSPHRGGQAVLCLDHPRYVHWAPTADPTSAERLMIEAFITSTGMLPFANRQRGWKRQQDQITI